jgi:hypothetical protein
MIGMSADLEEVSTCAVDHATALASRCKGATMNKPQRPTADQRVALPILQ